MASRAHTLVDTPTLVLVQVDHAPRDSFSRSVTPTALKRWRRSLNYSTATQYTAYDFAVPALQRGEGKDEVCGSLAAYASSHEDAELALKRHIESLAPRV